MRAAIGIAYLLLMAACGPPRLPAFANPPDPPDAGADDAGADDASE